MSIISSHKGFGRTTTPGTGEWSGTKLLDFTFPNGLYAVISSGSPFPCGRLLSHAPTPKRVTTDSLAVTEESSPSCIGRLLFNTGCAWTTSSTAAAVIPLFFYFGILSRVLRTIHKFFAHQGEHPESSSHYKLNIFELSRKFFKITIHYYLLLPIVTLINQ